MKRGRNQRRRQGVNINRAYDSNGPDVRIRGTANQIYDKYLALARDASSSGDRVKAENYFQHAEHYFRLIRSMQAAPQSPMETADMDAEQPSIGEGRDHSRENGAEPARPNGAGSEEDSAGEASEARGERQAEASPEAGEQGEGGRRPRRRRPRRSPRSEGDEAGERESEDAGEAVAAS